ncbi:MAG: helix-turn-helix transcriptional regulator [Oliverpabstia sp.]|nr:helix-turn-helix transcriptional regulator [Oliverpabstia sp.]
MTVGIYIKEMRIEKGMSQRELAAASNISNAEISRIESGLRKQPSGDVLKSIATALNVPCQNLFAAAGYIEETPNTKIPVHPDPAINENQYLCVSDLTAEEIEDVKKYIQFLKSKR